MMSSDKRRDPPSPLYEIERALEGLNLRALGLDRDELVLRASWWPSRGPDVVSAERKLDEERSRAVLAPGVWIYSPASKTVEITQEVIGKDADNRWAVSVLQMLIDRGAADVEHPEPHDSAATLPPKRWNNLGCARLWLYDWAGAQQAFAQASELDPVTRRGEPVGGFRAPWQSPEQPTPRLPGDIARANLAVLRACIRAHVDVLHARAEEQQSASGAR
jgi:hypothetical protein